MLPVLTPWTPSIDLILPLRGLDGAECLPTPTYYISSWDLSCFGSDGGIGYFEGKVFPLILS